MSFVGLYIACYCYASAEQWPLNVVLLIPHDSWSWEIARSVSRPSTRHSTRARRCQRRKRTPTSTWRNSCHLLNPSLSSLCALNYRRCSSLCFCDKNLWMSHISLLYASRFALMGTNVGNSVLHETLCLVQTSGRASSTSRRSKGRSESGSRRRTWRGCTEISWKVFWRRRWDSMLQITHRFSLFFGLFFCAPTTEPLAACCTLTSAWIVNSVISHHATCVCMPICLSVFSSSTWFLFRFYDMSNLGTIFTWHFCIFTLYNFSSRHFLAVKHSAAERHIVTVTDCF